MKRIATAYREIDKFGVGKDGFKKSVPGVSPATRVDDAFMNGLQESVMGVIERVGLVPSDDPLQLADAIDAVGAGVLADMEDGSGATRVGTVDSVAGSEVRSVFSIISERKRITSLRRAADPDWTLAFQRAAASGAKHIVAAQGNYNVDGALVAAFVAGQQWEFDGANINFPTVGGILFSANNIDDWGIDGSVTVAGAGLGGGAAAALYIAGANRFRVQGFGAKDMAGWGVKHDVGSASGTLRGDQGQFMALQISNCLYGFENTPGAEYCTMVAPQISGCTHGVTIAGGNTSIIGGNIVDNYEGLVVLGGSNNAHGIISGVNINHSTVYNLRCDGVTNGQSLADCHFYGSGGSTGALFFNNSVGINIDGGVLDAWVYNYSGAGSGYNYISNMYCPASYGDIERLDASSNVPQELIVSGMRGPGAYKTGISINDPSPVYVHANRAAADTQAIVGHTQLIFPTVAANGNRRGALNLATGATTVPAGMAGQYQIEANLYFAGTVLVAANCYAELLINGANARIFLFQPYGSTILTCLISDEIYLNAGDVVTIKATIDGTTKFFGGASWTSGMTIRKKT